MRDLNLIAQLASVPLFQDLDRKELTEILSGVERVRLSDGTALMEQGDPPSGAYLLLAGRVRVLTKLPGGGETLIAELGPGSLIGELGLILSRQRSATVRAVDEIETAFIDRNYFNAALLQLRPAAMKVLRRLVLILTERLHGRHVQIRALLDNGVQGSYFWPLPELSSRAPPVPYAEFDVRSFLPILPFFRRFNRADIDAIFALARIENLPRAHRLADRGTEPDTAYLVVHGAVASGFLNNGMIHQLNILGPGQLCLFGAVLGKRPASTSLIVRETATLLAFPDVTVRELCGGESQLTLSFLSAVNEHQANMTIRAGNHLTRLVGLSRLHRQFDEAVGTTV